MKPTAKHRSLVAGLSKEFGVLVRFAGRAPSNLRGFYGVCKPRSGRISLYETDIPSEAWFLSCLYHEICHVLCFRLRKYANYHTDRDFYPWRLRERAMAMRLEARITLRAERYVDRMARRMVAERHPGVNFEFSYEKPEDVALLKPRIAWLLDEAREAESRTRRRAMRSGLGRSRNMD